MLHCWTVRARAKTTANAVNKLIERKFNMTFTYRVLLKPSDICFKKKLLPSSFDDGIPLRETLQQLTNEEILIEDLPSIDVVWCQQKWVWYTLNNRRLWVFRELEKLGKCQYIATKRIEVNEHVDDFVLYSSAELIGESNIVEWDEDGCRITLFNSDAKDTTNPRSSAKETIPLDRNEVKEIQQVKDDPKIRREWRELTPLTVTVRWKEPDRSDADERVVKPDPPVKRDTKPKQVSRTEIEESQRKRTDSGYCGSSRSSGRTSPRDISDSETEYETVLSDTEFFEERRSRSRRFSRFARDRPLITRKSPSPPRHYSHSHRVPPSGRVTTSRTTPRSKQTSRSRPRRRPVCRPAAAEPLRALMFRRRSVYDRFMFELHHGGLSRLEQLALKTRLMNTCGFCFKNFRAGVSLSQHIEELKHWACTRCGKYFESYTALGQHKLALDHCNVY